ncbi:MAG: hypothetical protein ACI92A_001877, partial [Candidatus Paceibacteria bacterium]
NHFAKTDVKTMTNPTNTGGFGGLNRVIPVHMLGSLRQRLI